MEKITFENDETYLPVTAEQFETLTNEILVEFNKLLAPLAADANYFAARVMNVIHQLARTQGIVKKSVLFEACVNLVSKQVTFQAIEALEKSLKDDPEAASEVSSEIDDTPTNVNEVH